MRPLSPHLTVYNMLQVTSAFSILHRLSGFFIFLGILTISWWTILNVYIEENCLNEFFSSLCGKVVLFMWSLALFYHMLNGVRHLLWDIGRGFEIRTVKITGFLVFFGAIILTALSWFIALQ